MQLGPGIIDINEDEAGLTPQTLWHDDEQCLLLKAGEYLRKLNDVHDEVVALALLFNDKEDIVNAKAQAESYKKMSEKYQEWRGNQSDLQEFDALVAKYRELRPIAWHWSSKKEKLDELNALEEEIKTVYQDTLPLSTARFSSYEEFPKDLYKVALRPVEYRRKQWWIENLPKSDMIKIALRLKKDGYR
jgi:hypothetical protein